MFIQTVETPNPHTLKFIPGPILMEEGTWECHNSHEAKTSPLARRLFAIQGVEGLFYGKDFVSVTKNPQEIWDVLKPEILANLMEHFLSNNPLFVSKEPLQSAFKDLDPISQEICELLETRVRPAVAMDGGDIAFHSFEKGVVYVRMKGACSGCPSASATLKSGIENLLRYYIPEVTSVEPVP